jgi:hypothetical protein
MTIAENLIKFIENEKIEKKINRDNFATLIFKIQDGKVMRMEGEYAINAEDIKIGGTD